MKGKTSSVQRGPNSLLLVTEPVLLVTEPVLLVI
jgi:hypothetical protein